MKKYLFGMLAIVLAVGFSAFTKPVKKNRTATYFVYALKSGVLPTSLSSVETQTNWTKIGEDINLDCEVENGEYQACQIKVDARDFQTVGSGGSAYIAPSNNVAISAEENDVEDNHFIVTDVSEVLGHNSSTFSNEQEPE